MKKYTHLKKYIDSAWHNENYLPSREIFHVKILESHFVGKQPVTNPQIIFTGGCYGAGKGHTLRYMNAIGKINLNNYVYADPDKIRALFPESEKILTTEPENYGKLTGKEAGYIVELIEYYALENNYNIIIDGSLHDYEWHLIHFKMINDKFCNFNIIVIFVFAELFEIFERNFKRCNETKRCIPETSIIKIFNKMDHVFDLYSNTNIIKKCFKVRNYSQNKNLFYEDVSKIII